MGVLGMGFFRLVLKESQEKYFEHGLRIVLSKHYETVGKIVGEFIILNLKYLGLYGDCYVKICIIDKHPYARHHLNPDSVYSLYASEN